MTVLSIQVENVTVTYSGKEDALWSYKLCYLLSR
jgi:hypothetical protein